MESLLHVLIRHYSNYYTIYILKHSIYLSFSRRCYLAMQNHMTLCQKHPCDFYIAYIYFLSLKGLSPRHFKDIREVQCIHANPSPTKMKPPQIKHIPAVPNTHFPELTSTKALENRSALKCGLIINKYQELLQVEHFRVKSSTRKMKTLAPENNCFLAHLVIDFQLPLLPEVWILHIFPSSLPHSSSIILRLIDEGKGERQEGKENHGRNFKIITCIDFVQCLFRAHWI